MARRESPTQRNLRILVLGALLILALGLATLALMRPLPPTPLPAAAASPTAAQPALQTTVTPHQEPVEAAATVAVTAGLSPQASTTPVRTAVRSSPSALVGRPSATPTPRPSGAATAGELPIATPLPNDRMRTIRLDQLPTEAHDTLRLIAAGGPFPYRQDGAVFENREGRLPRRPAGYYREYTVVTPGSADRGARRLVRGNQGELYYTDDHYNSFRRVIP